MAQNLTMRCYHHHNCEDRPAVARCSKCGKGLCRECADNLKSEDTGKILCVDCLNEELATDVVWAENRKSVVKKELIYIVVGFVVGLILAISLASVLGYASFFFPTLLASFMTIVKKVKNSDRGFLIKILLFLILLVVSPIMFVWRIVKRLKDIKRLKLFSGLQVLKFQANSEYAEIAAKMTTRLTTDEFERELQIKFGAMLEANKEEAEKQMAKEREKYNEAMLENAKLAKAEKEAASQVLKYQGEMASLQAQVDETNKKNQRLQKQNAQTKRKTIDVDDDDIAA